MANFERLYDWQQMFAHQFEVFMDDGFNNFVPDMNPPKTYFAQAHKNLIRDLWQIPANEATVTSGALKRFFMVHRWHYAFTSFSRHAYHSPACNIFDCFISLVHEVRITPEMQPRVHLHQVWTRIHTLEFINTWIEVNDSMLNTSALDDSWVYRMTYECMVGCPEQSMSHLVNWLVLDMRDFDLDVFQYKLYTDRHKGPDTRPIITRMDLTSDKILQLSNQLNFDMTVA